MKAIAFQEKSPPDGSVSAHNECYWGYLGRDGSQRRAPSQHNTNTVKPA